VLLSMVAPIGCWSGCPPTRTAAGAAREGAGTTSVFSAIRCCRPRTWRCMARTTVPVGRTQMRSSALPSSRWASRMVRSIQPRCTYKWLQYLRTNSRLTLEGARPGLPSPATPRPRHTRHVRGLPAPDSRGERKLFQLLLAQLLLLLLVGGTRLQPADGRDHREKHDSSACCFTWLWTRRAALRSRDLAAIQSYSPAGTRRFSTDCIVGARASRRKKRHSPGDSIHSSPRR